MTLKHVERRRRDAHVSSSVANVAVRPRISPTVVAVCAAMVLWAVSLQQGGHATRYPAVPLSLATFLVVQLLAPRVRWNAARILGPGNVATMLFALQLVVIPTLLVLFGPYPGTLGTVPADEYVNTALSLQALTFACYAGGYVGWAKPVRPRPLLLEPGPTSGVAVAFMALGGLGLALAFPSVGALVDYFSGQGDIFDDGGPANVTSAAATFLRPFLAYGVIIVLAARIARRRPNARIRPVEIGLIVLAIAASATFDYNRASVVIPFLAIVTMYGYFGRRQSPLRLVVLLVILAGLGFAFGQYRDFYSGTRGGTINPAEAGLDRPGASFAENLEVYANGPQFWALIVQEVDRTGLRDDGSIVGSALFPVPVLGKPFRDGSGPVEYNELIYGKPDVLDQNLGFGAELYWNFGVAGVVVGYFLLGFAVRRFDDRVEGAPDALASYSWTYCGIWVALLVIDSISVLTQIITYFFWPVVAMFVVARLVGSRTKEVRS